VEIQVEPFEYSIPHCLFLLLFSTSTYQDQWVTKHTTYGLLVHSICHLRISWSDIFVASVNSIAKSKILDDSLIEWISLVWLKGSWPFACDKGVSRSHTFITLVDRWVGGCLSRLYCKLSGPNLVCHFEHKPIFEWCVGRCKPYNILHKDKCLKEIWLYI
jgi:hypothetical protein